MIGRYASLVTQSNPSKSIPAPPSNGGDWSAELLPSTVVSIA